MHADSEEMISLNIPQLKFGKELKLPAGVKSAKLIFSVLSVNLNAEPAELKPLTKLVFSLTNSEGVEAQTWQIPKPQKGHWILIAAGIFYQRPQKKPTENFSGCYLFVR